MNRKSKRLSAGLGLLAALLMTTSACKSEAEKHYEKAKELRGQERIDDAIAEFKLAAEADPHYAKPLYYIAQIYEHQEKYLESAEWYQKAIDADPDYVKSYAELVKAWLRAGEFDKAAAAAADALERRVVKRDMEAVQEIQELQVEIEQQRKAAREKPTTPATPPPDAAPTTSSAPTSPSTANP